MNPFMQLANASPSDRLPSFEYGAYVVQIQKCLWLDTKETGNTLLVEFKVLASDNGTPPNSDRKWYRPLKWGESEIAAFALACLGLRGKQGPDLMAALPTLVYKAAGPHNILMGRILTLNCHPVETRNISRETGKPHVRKNHGWGPSPDTNPEVACREIFTAMQTAADPVQPQPVMAQQNFGQQYAQPQMQPQMQPQYAQQPMQVPQPQYAPQQPQYAQQPMQVPQPQYAPQQPQPMAMPQPQYWKR